MEEVKHTSLANAIQAEFGGPPPAETQANTIEAKVAEPVKAEVATPSTETTTVDSKAASPSAALENKEQAPLKSFDELLSERTEGKWKTWDEFNESLSKPAAEPEPFKFANEKLAKINDYISEGGTLEDWIATQSINYDELSPTERIAYKMQLDDPDISDEEIELEIEARYGVSNWKKNPDDYDEGVEPNSVKLQKLKFEREANKALTELKAHQSKWATPQNKVSEVDAKAAEEASKKASERWQKDVDTTVKAFEKIPLKISDKETFDYTLTPQEAKEVAKITKALYTDATAMFSEFVDKNEPNGVNMKALMGMVIKAKTFDNAMAFAVDQARASGKSEVVKDIKNINFSPDGARSTGGTPPMLDQIAAGYLNNLKK